MVKLKTLKDIQKFYDLGGEIHTGTPEYLAKENRKAFLEHLKREAIAWIKALQKTKVYPIGMGIPVLNTLDKNSEFVNSEEWIKNFFNITEEELR